MHVTCGLLHFKRAGNKNTPSGGEGSGSAAETVISKRSEGVVGEEKEGGRRMRRGEGGRCFQVEFEWLRQYWFQGQRFARFCSWWTGPMEQLEKDWKLMETMV
ncbi:hypothetical protein FQN60_011389, partial [Etheostoma spectabile]